MAEEEAEGDLRRLVERLECGQRKLKRALGLMNKSTVKASEDRRRLGNRTREGKRTASPGHSPQKSADRPILRNVDSLPRKRARLVNLALSPPSSPPHSCGTHRRLSSTPKNTIAPSPDISLEEALLGEKGHHVTPCSKRKDLNTSQTAQELCDGSRKKKGLSVSFQLMGNDKGERESGMNTPARSLNSSRYGALEQRQRTPVIPRKQSGKDIQLLGYDWIAGLMDAGPHTSQFSEQHLQELREFRHVNRAECYMPEEKSLLPLSSRDMCSSCTHSPTSSHEEEASYTCMPSYVLNDRLFPIPINPNACPSCQGCHDTKPLASPRYIQISVPHSTLQAPYKLRSQQKNRNNSTASMSLSQHCQTGWQTARPTSVPPKPPADLKSYLDGDNGKRQQELTRELLNTSHAVEYSLKSCS